MKHGQCPRDLSSSSLDHSLIHLFLKWKKPETIKYKIYQLTKFGDSMSCDLNDIFKYAPCHKCHDVTNLVNQGMVLGFLYLKSGSKHETCFYNSTF